MSNEGTPLSTTPVDGKLDYSEGLNIGYRALAATGKSIDFPIGAGLGFGTWSLRSARLSQDQTLVKVELENKGQNPSRGLAMVFASKPDSQVVRPKEWLIGFARTQPTVGETELDIKVRREYLESFEGGFWQLEPGDYQLRVCLNFSDPGISVNLKV
jgi:beta-glucosidase